jgi:8-oxo-dGTP pyrophosphatase MutT (NUDIX family)
VDPKAGNAPVDWPVDLVERARGIAAGTAHAPEARDAATVVLLRDASEGLQVYLIRRVSSMAFAAGATVFPGGSVDLRDAHLPDRYWSGPAPREWMSHLSADEDLARALVCAAVRETFEESGVVLAGPTPETVVEDARSDDWETDRLALLDRTLAFAELLERRSLVMRADLLRPWAHWITPEIETRRFDTRFFVAALPSGQRTRDVGGEADRVFWMRPGDAVEAAQRGDISLMPPTLATLTELSAYGTVDDVLRATHERVITTILPKVTVEEADGDGTPRLRFFLPGDAGYPA